MTSVWIIRNDEGNLAAIAETAEAAKFQIELLERTTSYTYTATFRNVVTLDQVKRGLAQLDLKEQALAKLTKEEREALGHYGD